MLVIKMELWPFGDESAAKEIARCTIGNDGTGDEDTGNYEVALFNGKRKWKKGRVENFPRQLLEGWDLLYRGLHNILAGRNKFA